MPATTHSCLSLSAASLAAALWLGLAGNAAAQAQPSTLRLDTPVLGTLVQGDMDVYPIDGADTVTLTSLAGDADLRVFYDFDTLFDEPVCTSFSTPEENGGLDLCTLPDTGPYNVVVEAFTDTTYELVVTIADTLPERVPLQLDTLVQGTLAESDFTLYVTDGAVTVTLISLAGDADLYIYDELSFDEEALVCSATAFSDVSMLDVCDLPSGGPHFVRVDGFTDANYEISVTRTREVFAGPLPVQPDPVPDQPTKTRQFLLIASLAPDVSPSPTDSERPAPSESVQSERSAHPTSVGDDPRGGSSGGGGTAGWLWAAVGLLAVLRRRGVW